MEEKLQELIQYTKELCGLATYTLHTHSIIHDINDGFIFTTEWLPEGATVKDDENPAGTAVISINFHTKSLHSLVFVHGESHTLEGSLPTKDKDQLLDWLEATTDLMYGRQFQLVSEDEETIKFRASIDHIEVAPEGVIEVEFNEKGQLASFFRSGVFPTEDEMDWAPFSLTPSITDNIINSLCTIIEIPIEETESWASYYMLKEVFISNDGETITNKEDINDKQVYFRLNKKLEWTEKTATPFKTESISLDQTVTLTEAIAQETHSDATPITDTEINQCIKSVTEAVKQTVPNESGQWEIGCLYREHRHIIAEVVQVNRKKIFDRKLKVILNHELDVINLIDNTFLTQLLGHFKASKAVEITNEEAFNKLKEHVTIEPRYVYNRDTKTYQVHGEVVSPFAVDAHTGELVELTKILD